MLTFETISQWTTNPQAFSCNLCCRDAWLQSICINLPFSLTSNLIGLNVWPLTVLSYYFPSKLLCFFPFHTVWCAFTVFLFLHWISAQRWSKTQSLSFMAGIWQIPLSAVLQLSREATWELQFLNMQGVSWWTDSEYKFSSGVWRI